MPLLACRWINSSPHSFAEDEFGTLHHEASRFPDKEALSEFPVSALMYPGMLRPKLGWLVQLDHHALCKREGTKSH
jgi:hypothetical protein